MRKYFVWFRTSKYDADVVEEFSSLSEVETFLSARAENPEFVFSVVYGERVEFVPAVIVKAYRKKTTHD